MQKPEHEVSEEGVHGLCLTNGLVTSCRDWGSGWSQVETERTVCVCVCVCVCASVLEQDLIESEGLGTFYYHFLDIIQNDAMDV